MVRRSESNRSGGARQADPLDAADWEERAEVIDDLSTRRLRVVKYRGTSHGTNEYPFLIDAQGIAVVPITSIGLSHVASDEIVSSGLPELDAMLGGKGYFKGSSILLSGGPGKSGLGWRLAHRPMRWSRSGRGWQASA